MISSETASMIGLIIGMIFVGLGIVACIGFMSWFPWNIVIQLGLTVLGPIFQIIIYKKH